MSSRARRHSVVVADDHPVVLRGLVSLLEPEFQVVAACGDGAAALEAIRCHDPDIALLDFRMPKLTGLEVLGRLEQENRDTRVVFLTASATDRHALAAITRSARGIILKDSAADTVVDCLREVAADRRWVQDEVVESALGSDSQRLSELVPALRGLTGREQMVMRRVAEGLSNKDVARRLGVSEGTVKVHLHHIYEKTGLSNRTALTALALRLHSHDG